MTEQTEARGTRSVAGENNMLPCPHCGAANSAKKRICYNCQKEIATEEQPKPKPEPKAQPKNNVRAAMARSRQLYVQFAAPQLRTRRPFLAASALFGANIRQRVQFFRQLQGLLHAGVGIGQSLHFMEANVPAVFRPVVRDMSENVSHGIPFSSVMARYTNLFPEWEVNIIRAAEISGSLPEAVDEIANTLESEMRLRARVSTILPPMIATVVVFLLVILIVNGVTNLNGRSLVARLEGAGLTMLGIIVGVLVFLRLWRIFVRTRAGAFLINSVITGIPMLGPIISGMMRIRFARVLAAMWNAGVGPMESVLSAARASGNYRTIYRARYEVPQLGEGASLADVLEAVRIFPPDSMHIIRTGESTGTLPESLRKVAEYLQITLDAQVETLPGKLIILYYAIIVPIVFIFIFRFYTSLASQYRDVMP